LLVSVSVSASDLRRREGGWVSAEPSRIGLMRDWCEDGPRAEAFLLMLWIPRDRQLNAHVDAETQNPQPGCSLWAAPLLSCGTGLGVLTCRETAGPPREGWSWRAWCMVFAWSGSLFWKPWPNQRKGQGSRGANDFWLPWCFFCRALRGRSH
jgi:hypothetical protein